MSEYTPRVGDRVRVTIEGTVRELLPRGEGLRVSGADDARVSIVWPADPGVTIEKLPDPEPPEPQSDCLVRGRDGCIWHPSGTGTWWRPYAWGEMHTWSDLRREHSPLTVYRPDGAS